MNKIITNSNFQKIVGKISREISNFYYIVVNRGVPKMLVLPYFEDNSDILEDYLERYEISQNQKKIQEDLKDSKKSGISKTKI